MRVLQRIVAAESYDIYPLLYRAPSGETGVQPIRSASQQ